MMGSLTNWAGDTADFHINNQEQLQLLAPAVSASKSLWRASQALLEGQWEGDVEMHFNPSSANYSKVYLSRNDQEQGYYLKIGGTQDDVSLYRYSADNSQKIIDGTDDLIDQDSVRLSYKVLRDSLGNWTLWVDTTKQGNYLWQGSVFDNTYLQSDSFGISCTYTSTRSEKFFFDNFKVSGYSFLDSFPLPTYRSIVINEIMADPSPPQDWPEEEYIELYNSSEYSFNTAHLKLNDLSSSIDLPIYLLAPKAHLLLTKDCSLFPTVEHCLSVDLPSLNNSSDQLQLWRKDSLLIDELHYQDNWHDSAVDGGVSLEQINPYSNCSSKSSNWASSRTLSGGTPGQTNSLYNDLPDTEGPQLVAYQLLSPQALKLIFEEEAVLSQLTHPRFSHLQVEENTHTLFFVPTLDKGGEEVLSFLAKDCEGNSLLYELSFIVPDDIEREDILLNELLFNPKEGGVDFVEIYNNSNKLIDLQELSIANRFGGQIANIRSISDSSYILSPEEYLVLCISKKSLLKHHPYALTTKVKEMNSLPSFPNTQGYVYLLKDSLVIDSLHYEEDMHHPLLKELEGISLERIDPNTPSYIRSNWHSAAEEANFATPTLENSQHIRLAENESTLSARPSLFSPNHDGLDDVLSIQLHFSEEGFVGSLWVFDYRGVHIRQIVNNELFGLKNTYFWDGTTDKGRPATEGRYILLLVAHHSKGMKEKNKATVVLHRP
jgi:hypothetical protein